MDRYLPAKVLYTLSSHNTAVQMSELCSEFPNVDEDRLEEVIKQLVIDGYAKSSLDGYARITKDGKDAVVIMRRRPYKEATKTLEEVRKSIHKKDSSKRHL